MSFNKGNVYTIAIMVVVVAAASFYTWTIVQKNRTALTPESEALSVLKTSEGQLPFTDLEGNPVALTDFLGDVLVVSSWASWCPACAKDLPLLSTVAQTFENDGVRVLAINRSEPGNTAERFLRSINATPGIKLVLDPDDRFYESIGGYTMPETIFYDRTGKIVHHNRGSMTQDEMNQYVKVAMSGSLSNDQ